MKRKPSLIVSPLHDPEVVVLDQLTTGLNPSARREVWSIITGLRCRGNGTHSNALHGRSRMLLDKVYIVNQGRMVVDETPGELKKKYGFRAV